MSGEGGVPLLSEVGVDVEAAREVDRDAVQREVGQGSRMCELDRLRNEWGNRCAAIFQDLSSDRLDPVHKRGEARAGLVVFLVLAAIAGGFIGKYITDLPPESTDGRESQGGLQDEKNKKVAGIVIGSAVAAFILSILTYQFFPRVSHRVKVKSRDERVGGNRFSGLLAFIGSKQALPFYNKIVINIDDLADFLDAFLDHVRRAENTSIAIVAYRGILDELRIENRPAWLRDLGRGPTNNDLASISTTLTEKWASTFNLDDDSPQDYRVVAVMGDAIVAGERDGDQVDLSAISRLGAMAVRGGAQHRNPNPNPNPKRCTIS